MTHKRNAVNLCERIKQNNYKEYLEIRKIISLGFWRRAWQPLQCFYLENPVSRGAWRATVHRVIKVSDDLTAKQQQHIQYYQFSILFQCSLSLSLHSTPNPLAILHMAQTYLYHVYVMFKEKSYKEEMDNFFFFKELSQGEFASLLIYIDSKSST